MNRRHLLLAAGAATASLGLGRSAAAQSGAPVTVTGAGSSFVSPIYQKWSEAARAAIGVSLNYQSVGSGAGQTQIRNRTVDFGASDAPMTTEVLGTNNLFQFPTVMGSIVAIVNIPGVADNQLKLTGELLADIYLGKVTNWNDRRIGEINPGVTLPSLAIAPAYRADGSGTTYVWVSYLSKVSAEWREKVGIGTSVRFPAGTGARGNEGVAATVRNVRGAIGYVENAYAIQNHLVQTQIRNKAGNFVSPTSEAFLAAASTADWSVPNFAADLIETAGPTAWPIVSPTFVIMAKNPTNVGQTQHVLRFFDWAFRQGGQLARELEYIPLPDAVHAMIRTGWTREIHGANNQAVWPVG